MANERTITVNVRAVTTGFNDAMKKAADNTKQFTREASGAVTGVGAFGGAASKAAIGAEKFASGSLMAARGANALGLSAASSAAKVDGLVRVLQMAGQAAPEILAIGAAITSLAVSFDFVKDSIKDAADLQAAMAQLGQTIKNQGGDWDTINSKIRDFADLQASTTSFGRLDVINAIKQLTETGMNYADAMKTVRVAEDASAASGRSLTEVTDALMRVSKDMGRGLISLGLATKEQIKDGVTYNEALQLIEKNMGGAALAAGKTYPGALAQLGNAFRELKEDVGTAFLPTLTLMAQSLRDVVDQIDADVQPSLKRLADWFAQHKDEITKFFEEFGKTVEAAGKAIKDDLLPVALGLWDQFKQLNDAISSADGGLDTLNTSMYKGKSGWAEFRDIIHDIAVDLKQIGDIGNGLAGFFNKAILEKPGNLGKKMSGFWNNSPVGSFLKSMLPIPLQGLLEPFPGEFGQGLPASSFKFPPGPRYGSASSPPKKTPANPADTHTGVVADTGMGTKASADQTAKDALANFTEQIKEYLDGFANRVADAKHQLEKSKTAIENYTATLPGGKPSTASQAQHLEALTTTEIGDQVALRERLEQQHQAEIQAEQDYLKIATSISPQLKNHDELVRSAKSAAMEHYHAAQQIAEQYLAIDGTVAKLKSDLRAINVGLIERTGENAVLGLQGSLAGRTNARDSQIGSLEQSLAMGSVTGMRPEDIAAVNVQIARLKEQTAEDTAAVADHVAAIRAATAQATHNEADQKAAEDAKKAALVADNQLTVATYDLERAQSQFAHDLINRTMTVRTALDELVKKLNVPGLDARAGGGFTFSPLGFFLDALEQTKSFADIMRTVNAIVKVFANVLDSLRPIIDVLLDAIREVVNIFIFFYNLMARVLQLFGIHLQLLQALNAATSDAAVPLIQITHDIPTLNELAAGTLNGPLSTIPTGLQNINTAINSTGQQQIGILGQILGALLAIKLALMAEAAMKAAGGFMNAAMNLFGLGSSGGGGLNFAGVDLQGLSEGAYGSGMSDAVSSGMQDALATDGASASGGLQTAFSSAMQSAAPYLLAAAGGAALGSILEPGRAGAAIGGGAGAAIGLAIGGPVGAAIGAVAGTLFGGLFGGPRGAGSQPDLNDSTFGQKIANLQGGTAYTAGFGTATNQSGFSGGILSYIQSSLAGNGTQIAQVIGQSAYQQLLQEFGTSGGGKLNFGHNIENESVAGGSLSGNYNSIYAAATAAAQQIQTALGGAAGSFTQMLHAATDVHAWMNELVNDTAQSAQAASNSLATVTQALTAAAGTSAGAISITHSVSMPNATINGIGDVQDLGQELADSMIRRTTAMRYELGRRNVN